MKGSHTGRRDLPFGQVPKECGRTRLFSCDLNVLITFQLVFRHKGMFHVRLGHIPAGIPIPDLDKGICSARLQENQTGAMCLL